MNQTRSSFILDLFADDYFSVRFPCLAPIHHHKHVLAPNEAALATFAFMFYAATLESFLATERFLQGDSDLLSNKFSEHSEQLFKFASCCICVFIIKVIQSQCNCCSQARQMPHGDILL
jgi:hypothetical protein